MLRRVRPSKGMLRQQLLWFLLIFQRGGIRDLADIARETQVIHPRTGLVPRTSDEVRVHWEDGDSQYAGEGSLWGYDLAWCTWHSAGRDHVFFGGDAA